MNVTCAGSSIGEKFVRWKWTSETWNAAAEREQKNETFSRSMVITKKKEKKRKGGREEREKKSSPGATLTFQKRQSHRGKSRSSGIKTEVRYHVCVCVGIRACTALFFLFSFSFLFFFSFFATNVAVELLKRSELLRDKREQSLVERKGKRRRRRTSNVRYFVNDQTTEALNSRLPRRERFAIIRRRIV